MPITGITKLYYDLLNVVPEHMAALNVCLVSGGLRPATLIEPDMTKGVLVEPATILPRIESEGLSHRLWSNAPTQLLVYQPGIELEVQKSRQNKNDHILFGKILGYRCLGEFQIQGITRYFVNFIVQNPQSRSDNPFMGYICTALNSDLIEKLRVDGRHFKTFFEDHEITGAVKLHIWFMQDGQRHDIINEWL